MSGQTDFFLGLTNTAWTAISSISTFLAVLVALSFPISEKLGRRKKIYRIIESEIRKNFHILEKAKSNNLSAFFRQSVPKSVVVAFTLRQINIDYWEENKQFVSESSLKKFDEYSEINNDLGELKLFAQDLLFDTGCDKYLEKIMIALENTYIKMKKKEKCW